MNTTDRIEVAHAMIDYGGSFVSALGKALLYADENNANRIRYAFPDYWIRYGEMAKTNKEGTEA